MQPMHRPPTETDYQLLLQIIGQAEQNPVNPACKAEPTEEPEPAAKAAKSEGQAEQVPAHPACKADPTEKPETAAKAACKPVPLNAEEQPAIPGNPEKGEKREGRIGGSFKPTERKKKEKGEDRC